MFSSQDSADKARTALNGQEVSNACIRLSSLAKCVVSWPRYRVSTIAIYYTPLRRPMLQVLGSRIKVLLAEPSRNTEKDAEEPVEVGRGEA